MSYKFSVHLQIYYIIIEKWTHHSLKHPILLNFQSVECQVAIYVFHCHLIQVSVNDEAEKNSVKKEKTNMNF